MVVGTEWGRVRSLRGTGGAAVKEVLPGQPAEIAGLKGLPRAGDQLLVRVARARRALPLPAAAVPTPGSAAAPLPVPSACSPLAPSALPAAAAPQAARPPTHITHPFPALPLPSPHRLGRWWTARSARR